MNVAITGSIGSGKSTVARMLASLLGGEYLDSDQLCRQAMRPGEGGYRGFVEHYGGRYLLPDGSIDRPLLRQAVFADPGLRSSLEQILHPLVRRQVVERSAACTAMGRILVAEVPLLFEVGWQSDFSCTVVVYVEDNLLVERVGRRDGLSAEEVAPIMAVQMAVEEKIALADFALNNSGTYAATLVQTNWLAGRIRQQIKKRGSWS